MNNLIVSKTSLDEVEMTLKVALGFESFEIHLDADFQRMAVTEYGNISKRMHDIIPDVVAVHTHH